MDERPPRITRVALKNFKSIAACDVLLGPLTILVGRNGSGKSNFVDSLRFASDALTTTLDHALRDRGGINEVRRRSGGHPTHFGARFEISISDDQNAVYAFEIAARRNQSFTVKRELCQARGPDGTIGFERVDESIRWLGGLDATPALAGDRLMFVSVAGVPELRSTYDALTGLGTYNLNPDVVRSPQPPDPGAILARDGRNLASIVGRMDPESKSRVEQYLSVIVPGLSSVERKPIGSMETLEFRQEVAGSSTPWRFPALNMSDGTLRATGILAALFQGYPIHGSAPLVAIEEPEIALHPAAADALYDALSEASAFRQVLVTSHSPELLDNPQITATQLRAVDAIAGETVIGPVSNADRLALADGLYSAGELLRIGQIAPSEDARVTSPLRLFDEL